MKKKRIQQQMRGPNAMPKRKLPVGWHRGQMESREEDLAHIPPRQLALLAAAWAERVVVFFERDHPGDRRPHEAISAAVAWAMDPTPETAHAALGSSHFLPDTIVHSAAAAAYSAAECASVAQRDTLNYLPYLDPAAYSAECAANSRAGTGESLWPWLYDTYTRARGPKGVAFAPAWRSETAVSLAKGIVADRAFDRMPILADALEEAGCDVAEVLAHLRTDPPELFTLADWSLGHLTGMTEPIDRSGTPHHANSTGAGSPGQHA